MIQVIPELVDVNGRKRVKVTIRDGERVLDADLIDPFQATQRRRAAQRLAERAGEPHAAERIEQALLQCVDAMEDARKKAGDDDANAPAADRETAMGAMRVVRPELILCDGVVAVSVPEVIVRDGQAVGRWRVYLRLAAGETGEGENGGTGEREKDGDGGDDDGGPTEAAFSTPDRPPSPVLPLAHSSVRSVPDRRECRPLAARIDVGGGVGTLWVHPVPSAPSPSTPAGWSDAARRAWLAGSADADVDVVALFDEIVAALGEYLDVDESKDEGGRVEAKDEGRRMKDESDGMTRPVDSFPTHPSSFVIHPSAPPPHPLLATLALWTMLTYLYVAWDAVPYLFVTGPAGSGKTRVFELLSRLCFRPLASSNLSAPALFRTLHDRGGTLLLDEAERLSDAGDDVAELRSILLAGYKRGGRASRLESTGGGDGGYQMSEFQVYGPKAIACINTIPPALASRCIPVQMFRSPPGSDKPRQRIDRDPARWQRLRDALHAALLGPLGLAAPALSLMSDCCPLGGRQYELWQPILALAAWLDCERGKRSRRARDEDGIETRTQLVSIPGIETRTQLVSIPSFLIHPRVLAYARRLCDGGGESLLPEEDFLLLWTLTECAIRGKEPNSKKVLDMARSADADAMRGVSARRVAEVLKRYGLHSTRSNGKNIFRDVLGQLKAIEVRYGVDLNTVGKDTVRVVGSWY